MVLLHQYCLSWTRFSSMVGYGFGFPVSPRVRSESGFTRGPDLHLCLLRRRVLNRRPCRTCCVSGTAGSPRRTWPTSGSPCSAWSGTMKRYSTTYSPYVNLRVRKNDTLNRLSIRLTCKDNLVYRLTCRPIKWSNYRFSIYLCSGYFSNLVRPCVAPGSCICFMPPPNRNLIPSKNISGRNIVGKNYDSLTSIYNRNQNIQFLLWRHQNYLPFIPLTY